MRFYEIDIEYIKYLFKFDKRVQYNDTYGDNKNQNRPYIGVVLEINGYKYFAPLEHPRPKHQTIKNKPQIYKIKWGRLGIIGLNNMIPVPEIALLEFDINSSENKDILISQYIDCKQHWSVIQNKAKTTYEHRVHTPREFDIEVCCDFELLEQKSLEYSLSHAKTLADKLIIAQDFAQKQNTAEKTVPEYNRANVGKTDPNL